MAKLKLLFNKSIIAIEDKFVNRNHNYEKWRLNVNPRLDYVLDYIYFIRLKALVKWQGKKS